MVGCQTIAGLRLFITVLYGFENHERASLIPIILSPGEIAK